MPQREGKTILYISFQRGAMVASGDRPSPVHPFGTPSVGCLTGGTPRPGGVLGGQRGACPPLKIPAPPSFSRISFVIRPCRNGRGRLFYTSISKGGDGRQWRPSIAGLRCHFGRSWTRPTGAQDPSRQARPCLRGRWPGGAGPEGVPFLEGLISVSGFGMGEKIAGGGLHFPGRCGYNNRRSSFEN